MSNLAKSEKPTAIATLRDLLEKSKPKLAEVMPKHMSADRLMRIAIAACSRTPALLQCTPMSVLNAVMQGAQLGLEPGGPLGDAYLVPYKDQCQFIPGYRGLISLARRSGQIQSIEAHVVHAKDKFTCRYGLDSKLEHEPDWSEDPGPVVAVYAVAKLKDGGTQCEVMTKTQVDKIRARSKASGSGPWVSDYEEMARKTVVRRLCKYLPLSVELAQALEADSSAEDDSATFVSLPPTEEARPTRTEKVKETLRAATSTVTVEPPAADPVPESVRDAAEVLGGEVEPGEEG
jgi:recombination protein RecT